MIKVRTNLGLNIHLGGCSGPFVLNLNCVRDLLTFADGVWSVGGRYFQLRERTVNAQALFMNRGDREYPKFIRNTGDAFRFEVR